MLLYIYYFFLLSGLAFLSACKTQRGTTTSQDMLASLEGHPSIVKTQGGNEFCNIHCSLIDKNGNLWFGTMKEGAYRYDGKQFIQITTTNGLSDNTIWSMAEDKTGDIWFGTAHGVSMYNGKQVSAMMLQAVNEPADSMLRRAGLRYEVSSILCDRSGKLWFGTSNGVYCYDGKQYTRFLLNDGVINKKGLQLKGVQCIFEDDKGNIWFGSGPVPVAEGLCRYDGKELVQFNPGGATWIRTIVQDKKGTIWLTTRNQGNWQYDGKTFSKFTAKEGVGTILLLDRSGNIWFGGGEDENGYNGKDGIWRFDGTSFKNIGTANGLGNYSAWSIIEDRAGKIWIGTRNNGLYRYDGQTVTPFSE